MKLYYYTDDVGTIADDIQKRSVLHSYVVRLDILRDEEGNVSRTDYRGLVTSVWFDNKNNFTLGMSNGDIITLLKF